MAGLRLAGVIGDPVAHSKSPLIHNTWLKRAGLPGLYAPLRATAETFEAVVETGWAMGFVGFNVTIPHKERAYRLVDRLTPSAEAAGAVNTLWRDSDGGVVGDNSDGFGFLENLKAGADGWEPDGRSAVILGAGGAARAVAAALLAAGVERLTVANRTAARAEAIAAMDPERARAAAWPPEPSAFEAADLIVNATSLGMVGQPPFDLALPPLGPRVLATDLIYAPLDTPFLQAAAAAGARTVDGLGMLLHQARPGFARWFGVAPTVDAALRDAVLTGEGCLP